jgi:hypothetical protein
MRNTAEEEEEEEAEYEDDVISRLGIMEQELLQEQEGTKSEVLGENNTDSYINDMIERKLTDRFNRMETEWELKLNQVTEEAATISRKAERVWQMERRVSPQAEDLFKVIREATDTLNSLEVKLTLAQDRIEEVDKSDGQYGRFS